MKNIICLFAKVSTCVAVIVGAPLLAASAINLYITEATKDLEYRACLRTAELDNIAAGFDLYSCKR